MKRVLASLLFLVTMIQAGAPAHSGAAGEQPRLVSVTQSPYDVRFHIEQQEWDQVDATLQRIPTNYQFDAYKGNTPLMVMIDLFAQKAADKPKSFWQTAVGGTLKVCSGAALLVVGLAFALRAKSNWDIAKPIQPKAAKVPLSPVIDRVDADDEAEAKEGVAQPRVRLQHPPHQDKTDAIRQKLDADRKTDQHRAQEEQSAIDAKNKAAREPKEARGSRLNPLNHITPLAERLEPLVDRAVDSLKGEVHKVRYQDLKPALATVKAAAMNVENQTASVAASVHGAVEDARDLLHEGRQALHGVKKLNKKANNVLNHADHAARQVDRTAAQAEQTFEKVDAVADQVSGFLTGLGGLGGIGLFASGLWAGWKGIKNIKSLLGLGKRSHDLSKLKSFIVDLLHRKDINLAMQNSDGETALQMVRRYMAENMDDRENYQLLSEVEQIIMVRTA